MSITLGPNGFTSDTNTLKTTLNSTDVVENHTLAGGSTNPNVQMSIKKATPSWSGYIGAGQAAPKSARDSSHCRRLAGLLSSSQIAACPVTATLLWAHWTASIDSQHRLKTAYPTASELEGLEPLLIQGLHLASSWSELFSKAGFYQPSPNFEPAFASVDFS